MYEESIRLLNKAVADELASIHQYMYFHFHCDDQGFDILASLFRRTAIEEMMHVEKLAERILFLKGDVEMEPSAKVQAITDVREMVTMACDLEQQAIIDYNKMAVECGNHADSVSKKLFEALVNDEERHFSQYDFERENLVKFGDNYLAMQSMERSRLSSSQIPGAGGAQA